MVIRVNDLRKWMGICETLTPVVYHGGVKGIENSAHHHKTIAVSWAGSPLI
jgi:hypothetical protein